MEHDGGGGGGEGEEHDGGAGESDIFRCVSGIDFLHFFPKGKKVSYASFFWLAIFAGRHYL